jgi:hypothetical protein
MFVRACHKLTGRCSKPNMSRHSITFHSEFSREKVGILSLSFGRTFKCFQLHYLSFIPYDMQFSVHWSILWASRHIQSGGVCFGESRVIWNREHSFHTTRYLILINAVYILHVGLVFQLRTNLVIIYTPKPRLFYA